MILPSELETIALLELVEALEKHANGMDGFRAWWIAGLSKKDRDLVHAHDYAKLLASQKLSKLWDDFTARSLAEKE